MAQVTAKLHNYRQSPRKVRLVADFVKGKKVDVALAKLTLLPKRAAGPVQKLVKSAIANAKTAGFDADTLVVENLTVDQGVTLMRRMPRARGRAMPIRKRTSHLKVTLHAPDAVVKAEKKAPKKAPAKTETKAKPAPKAKKTVKKESK